MSKKEKQKHLDWLEESKLKKEELEKTKGRFDLVERIDSEEIQWEAIKKKREAFVKDSLKPVYFGIPPVPERKKRRCQYE